MEKIKSESGITIMVLVITVALIIIILAISLKTGVKDFDASEQSVQISELQTVQTAVLNREILHKKSKSTLVGNPIATNDVLIYAKQIGVESLVSIPENYPDSDYYVLTPELLEQIGISNAVDSYIVNYASGEVINYTSKSGDTNVPLYLIGTTTFENNL